MAINSRIDDTDLDAALAALEIEDAPRDRVERIRGRALHVLAHNKRRRVPAAPAWPRFEPLAALVVGAVYLAAVFKTTLALYG